MERFPDHVPIYGAVLIGGKSRRMGRAKHLIQTADGRSWLEYLVSIFEPFVARQFVCGAGELPGAAVHLERVDDLAGVEGPLAGIGALLRRFPYVSWLVSGCDMPHIRPEAVQWLLEQRDGSEAAVIPSNRETGNVEPLFAYYDYRCRGLVDDLIASGSRRISDLCEHPAIRRPEIPPSLASCWQNINFPDQL